MYRKYLQVIALALLTVALILPSAACQQGGNGADLGATLTRSYNNFREWFIMQGAKDRIEKIRKGAANIMVVDGNGTPVRDARVYFEQQSHDFLFGSNLAPLGEPSNGPNGIDQDWANAYEALFNYGTLPFYWDVYEPKQGQTAEQALRAMADWARKRNIITEGSPLISADAVPAWAPPAVNDMQAIQEKRVKEITGDLCGLVDYWDVVSEPTLGPRVNTSVGSWMNSRTPAIVCSDALSWARSACPKANLIINDFRTDQDFRDILEGILRQHSSYDAIGIETDMLRGNWPLYQVWDICDRFKDLNVPIHFTEVTILSGSPSTDPGAGGQQSGSWPSTPAGELAQADYAEKLYTMLFSNPSVQAITWWNFSDKDAAQGAPSGLLRADMSKKPAYDRLLKLIRDDWWSRGNAYTGNSGTAVFRGFFGQYKLIVEKDNKRVESGILITRGLENKLQIQLTDYTQLPPTPLYQLIWPYAVALVVIVIIVLIVRWIDKMQRRI
ncbi:MAG: endo-1,4-beta-xylanase [Dehalococcoidia bacterium]|jgi:GH35 family endo-1,4-beta-xylanase